MTATVEISSSKSLVNRYLILKKGHSELDFSWSSKAKDVLNLERALLKAPEQKEYEIGEGGTTLRFFTAYLSTFQGEWTLNCKDSLLKRPQEELIAALEQLGIELRQVSPTSLKLKSKGWKSDNISIDAKDSTQVLTGLVLAAVSRELPLKINIKEQGANSDYFQMTLDFLKALGFDLKATGETIEVPSKHSDLTTSSGRIESDWSSAAFLFVLASLKGSLSISFLEEDSLQPDAVVVDLLKSLGVNVTGVSNLQKGELPYKSFEMNLQASPDLFPVLSVLACFCEGKSKLFGAPQLKNKETNRIVEMQKLLSLCGYKVQSDNEGIIVEGEGLKILTDTIIEFDVSKDHRLYMATEILCSMGYSIKAKGAESILKSFAEYENLKQKDLACFF